MRTLRTILGRTFVVAALFVATPVWADEPAKANEPAKAAAPVSAGAPVPGAASAQALYDEGKRLLEADDLKGAQKAFEESMQAARVPKTAGQLGGVLLKLGNYVDAAENLEWFLREDKEVPQEVKDAVRKMLADAKAKIATVRLNVDQRDAMVRVNGRATDGKHLLWPIYLSPGDHTFQAEKKGFVTATVKMRLSAGEDVPVELVMVPGPDDVRAAGSPEKPKDDKRPTRVTAAWIAAAGLGAVAVGTGIGAMVTYSQAAPGVRAYEQYKKTNSCDERCMVDFDNFVAYHVPTQALTIVATATGVAGAGIAAFLIFKRQSAPEKSTGRSARIGVSPGIGGVVVHGCW